MYSIKFLQYGRDLTDYISERSFNMTIVVNGMSNKALSRLLMEDGKNEEPHIDFVGGVCTEEGILADVFFTDAEWRITTGTCNDTEFVEIKNVSESNKFMFVLTSGEFDSLVIA